MIDARTYGAPNWVDLSTSDIQGATIFYRDLLGWTIERQETPMGDYFIGGTGDLEVAGMMQAGPDQQGMPAMWTVFFFVADVDETVSKVQAAGGTVLEPPLDIPDARIAIVADPAGSMFGVIGGHQPEGVWMSNRHGAVCWVELLTRDPAAAEDFYASVFGWKPETQEYSGRLYTTFKLGEDSVAGMMMMPDEVPAEAPAHWSLYFAVDDCSTAETRVQELGGQVLRPTMDMGEGSFAVLADPYGATFQVMEYAT